MNTQPAAAAAAKDAVVEPLTIDKLATFEAVEMLQGSKELLQLADVLEQQVPPMGARQW